MVLLDTHIWVWWLFADSRLTEEDRLALDQLAAAHDVAISAISIWEVQMLVTKNRISIHLPFEQWIREATRPDMVNVVPIDSNVGIALYNLPADFHGDPADKMIIASAISRGCSLVTADKAMRRSALVKCWTLAKRKR